MRRWEAIKNSSWGDNFKQNFGENSGYVICYMNFYNERVALAAVIGQPYISQTEIDENAKLIQSAPDFLEVLHQISNSENGNEAILLARSLLEKYRESKLRLK